MKETKRKRFEIPMDLDSKLNYYCKINQLSQSEAVQEGLMLLFEQEDNIKRQQSFEVQLLNQLIQVIEGLSHQNAADTQSIMNRLDVLIQRYDGVTYMNNNSDGDM